nr:hypothetical protein [Tanacetum cinerariifolium]
MIIDSVVDAAQVTTVVVDILISTAETIVTTAPTTTAKNITQAPKVKDNSKGKAIMIEEPKVPKKRKVLERLDKEYAEWL